MIKSMISSLAALFAPAAMAFTLTSPDFKDQDSIPSKFTCKGDDATPTLTWDGVPAGTQTFVLTMVDPEATHGSWTHWVVYNIPANVKKIDDKSDAGMGGFNSWKKTTYGGPCPPSGTHHYIFTLYAVDIILGLKTTPTLEELTEAIEPHILGKAQLIGVYP